MHVASPVSSRSRQSKSPVDSVLHACPGAQPEVVQESPSAGSAAHKPQVAFFVPEQNRVAHCPAKAQVAPLPICPGRAQSGGGLAPLSKRSEHDQFEYSLAHFSSWAGVLLVPGAARLFWQASFARATQVFMSP